MTTPPTLLALPRELRNLIYLAILDSESSIPDSNTAVPHRLRTEKPVSSGAHRTGPRNATYWLTVSAELRGLLESGTLSQHKGCTTYHACLSVVGHQMTVEWLKLPVPVDKAKHLDVTMDFTSASNRGWWGDGGPDSLTRMLWEPFNMFVHRGPDFSGKRLEKPLQLESMNVRFITRDEEDEEQRIRSKDRNSQTAAMFLSSPVMAALMRGYVRTLRVECKGLESSGRPVDITLAPHEGV
ncbi:hypothetical protein H2203_007014 [Taxawa tesnikishii (nom. ined.)]|nr:hypothetical protein H2203_007014 [Dothideales sp. JES 119]